MAKLSIKYESGALQGVAASQDHISGFIFVGSQFGNPTGITSIEVFTGGHIIQLTSKEYAESLGITSTAFPYVHHQIKNFFLAKPDGVLWTAFITDTGTTYDEIPVIQKYTEAKVRQFGIWDTRELDTTILANINTELENLKVSKMNAIAIVGMDTKDLTYTALPDLAASSYSNIAVMVGQDGNSTLSGATVGSVPEVGAVLGRTADMAVNVSPGYFRLNVYDTYTTEPALGDGTKIKSLSDSYLETNLDDKNYMRFQKVVGDNSVYLNQSFTATSRTSDYKSVELNRVINKVARQVNLYLSKELNSPIELDSDGYIALGRKNELENIAGTGLRDMKGAGEVSAFSVFIDPTQNVLGTNKLEVVVKVVPYATANEIEVSLGFATSL